MKGYLKKYVGVILEVSEVGLMTPLYVIYEGERFKIDRVCERRMAPPAHVGAALTKRYTLSLGGAVRYLYEEEGRYFVEKQIL